MLPYYIDSNKIGGALYCHNKVGFLDINVALMRKKFDEKMGSMFLYSMKCGIMDVIKELDELTGEVHDILPCETNENWIRLFQAQICLYYEILPTHYQEDKFYFITHLTKGEARRRGIDRFSNAIQVINSMANLRRSDRRVPQLDYNITDESRIEFTIVPQQLIFSSVCYFCTSW